MKKLSLLIAGLMVSGTVSAVQLDAPGGFVRMTDCSLLNEDVSIRLTNNVSAGIACNAQAVAIASCHINGRSATRTQDVTTCTGTGDAEVCETAPQTVTGPAIANATTLLGTVITNYPGGLCTAATAEAFAGTRLPAE